MAGETQFCVCQCFLSHNIFLKNYEAHIVFENEGQFQYDYQRVLRQKGCKTDAQWKNVMKEVKGEIERRRNMYKDSQTRRELIVAKYKPLHPHVYTLKESYLADSFLSIVQYAKSIEQATTSGLLAMLDHCDASNVYAFQVFTPAFCEDFIQEINNFESTDLPKGRPNTMNKYGIVLNELGFDEGFCSPLRTNYLTPITKLLFPDHGGDSLDSHKAFTVHYRIGEDLDLSYHYDNAEVTLNVSLGKAFTGGELFFGDMRQVPLKEAECTECEHKPSYGLLHRGQHMHGALPIQSGERINLIIWMRSSTVRNRLCPMCNRIPRLTPCAWGTGDGFTIPADSVPVCTAL
ncbi:2-oxoglutarate and iron-dependent oxygenase domain-containing protein 2-like [Montipora capricornis]|uniref:2-oxoglutarate and iron-dependent oxygenase domain-containing protein 2-like n=1 Tax=Montipora capricornis TaxID=246305 RepID=UPI0035F20B74